MTAHQWAVLGIAAVPVMAGTAWVTSIRVWRRRNQAWHGGRWT